jgi:hypothetical protein
VAADGGLTILLEAEGCSPWALFILRRPWCGARATGWSMVWSMKQNCSEQPTLGRTHRRDASFERRIREGCNLQTPLAGPREGQFIAYPGIMARRMVAHSRAATLSVRPMETTNVTRVRIKVRWWCTDAGVAALGAGREERSAGGANRQRRQQRPTRCR